MLIMISIFIFLIMWWNKKILINVEDKNEIYDELTEELSKIEVPAKQKITNDKSTSGLNVYGEDFTIKVYYILSKYATRMKKSLNEKSFLNRIEFLRNEDHGAYATEFHNGEKEEAVELKRITGDIMRLLKIIESDYVISMNYHSRKPEFKSKMMQIQGSISKEIFTEDEISPKIPESLDEEKATEIRDFARQTTNKIISDLTSTIKDQSVLNDRMTFEISKLDDVIYLKYGFKNKEVIKAFEKYSLLGNQANKSSPITS